ncbi:MAG TPA: DNA repair protein RecO [Terriglobia bacterium]|nr:DNA repair protein RecO [Terriglobia bacterium]
MPLLETEAIVLRTYRLGEADKIVSLLTRQHGRLRAVAAGAQRPKSRFGGTLESLTYIRLWLFERENRDLLRINSGEILESFFDMQRDYRLHVASQYVAEAAEKLLPEREINERAFRLVVAVLRAMKRTSEVDRPLIFFNYWLLRLGGTLPNLRECGKCGRPFDDSPVFIGRNFESLVCGRCERPLPSQQLSGAVLALARRPRQSSVDAWLDSEPSGAGEQEARNFLESLVEAHAEKKLVTRSLLNE